MYRLTWSLVRALTVELWDGFMVVIQVVIFTMMVLLMTAMLNVVHKDDDDGDDDYYYDDNGDGAHDSFDNDCATQGHGWVKRPLMLM